MFRPAKAKAVAARVGCSVRYLNHFMEDGDGLAMPRPVYTLKGRGGRVLDMDEIEAWLLAVENRRQGQADGKR